jgi:hypothetical protein
VIYVNPNSGLSGSPLFYFIVAIIIGALIGYVACELAAKRSKSQPIEQDPEAEWDLVGVLCANPVEWLRVEEVLKIDHFIVPEPREAYRTLSVAAEELGLAKYSYRGEDEAEMDEAVLAASGEADLIAQISALVSQYAQVDAEPAEKPNIAVIRLGAIVASNGMGREQSTTRSPFVYDDETGLLSRGDTLVTPLRRGVNMLLSAAGACLIVEVLRLLALSDRSQFLGAVAGAALIFVAVEFANVDLDTFYLDSPIFYAAGGLAWLVTVCEGYASGHPSRLLQGSPQQ